MEQSEESDDELKTETGKIQDSGISIHKQQIIGHDPSEQQTSVVDNITKRNFLISSIECNKKYKDSLYILIRKVEENLHKIGMKRKALRMLMNQSKQLKERDKDSEYFNYVLGAPYFKDEHHFPACPNPELHTIHKNRILRYIHLNSRGSWSTQDKIQVKQSVLRQLMSYKNSGAPLHNLSDIIDWEYISSFDVPSHTAEECRSMWELFLRPELRKTKWTSAESSALSVIAKKNVFRDWDDIAKQLGGKRSSLQCFIHFQSGILNNNTSEWTKTEDQLLINLVEKLRIGKNYIPWPKISGFFQNRTKEDIYTRYTAIDPNIKKGYFTEEEDKALLAAVIAYNENFDAIPLEVILPGRSIKQARSRYVNTLSHAHIPPQVWDLDSDMKLLELVKKYGRKWSFVANVLEKRTRASCRHRFDVLQQFMNKNPELSLADAPRKLRVTRRFFPIGKELTKTNIKDPVSIGVIKDGKYETSSQDVMSGIDSKLSEYFSGMEYYGDKMGSRIKTFFRRDEVKSMYKSIRSLFKLYNTTISRTKLEKQITNGNFNHYTETEKLLLNYMLDNHVDQDRIFTSESSNEKSNEVAEIPTACAIQKREDFPPLSLSLSFSSKKVKTYSKKCKENSNLDSKITVRKFLPPMKNSASIDNESNERYFLTPNFSSLVGMRTLILIMGDLRTHNKVTTIKFTNPAQQRSAEVFNNIFQKTFLWPSILSYVNPDSKFRVNIENTPHLMDVTDEEISEEKNELRDPTNIQPYSKYRGRIQKRKYADIDK